MDNESLSFGEWLLGQIHRRGWIPADFARESGINDGVVSNWVTDKRKPKYENCVIISNVLRIPLAEVLRRANRPVDSGTDIDLSDPLISFAAYNQHRISDAKKLAMIRFMESALDEEDET